MPMTTKISRNAKLFILEFFFSSLLAVQIYAWAVNNGVEICTSANSQEYPTIISDGSGGAIITWEDGRSGVANDVYAQRVNSTESTLWTLNGVAICTAGNGQQYPMIVSDGSDGAIITWTDYRSDSNGDIYAQQVSSTGVVPVEDWFDYAGDMTLLKRE